MSSHATAIDKFVDYFHEQGLKIDQVNSLLYRKVLYATALDPVARAAFGNEETHRNRVCRVLAELAGWPYADRVSLPQLCMALLEGDLESSPLYANARGRLNHWPSGHVLTVNGSPKLSELSHLATDKRSTEILYSCQYVPLFYTYRNNLVHEFREPGYGMEMSSDGSQPYYHSMSNPEGDDSWELVFPVGFFSKIYSGALKGLKEYLLKADVDPYDRFNFGSRWRAK
ncbi:hypothetical protein ACFQUU_29015 [Herbaspirillum sp. GCM10030257]|uniref:hypothetical protein n=1 Tax=Herbaspirillum sp. GCM10030257 TaxID=3273393 RepID=UPI0036115F8A